MDDWSLQNWINGYLYIAKELETNEYYVVTAVYGNQSTTYDVIPISRSFPDYESALAYGLLTHS